ncbi:MAG: zinc ribbon domain-containing protein [Acidimicrobiales bacterium]
MDHACTHCGTVVPEETRFCPNCGQALAADSPAASPPVIPVGATTSETRVASQGVQLSFAQWVLAGATVLLFVALLLPWWSVTAVFVGSVSLDGFNSWGWLSFVAWLVIAALAVKLVAGDRLSLPQVDKVLEPPLVPKVLVGAGAAELLGNVLFIIVAPTGSGTGYSAGIGAGVVIAIICGLAVVYSGLLMMAPAWLPRPKATR